MSMTDRKQSPPTTEHPHSEPLPPAQHQAGQWSIRNASLTAGVALLLMTVVAIFGNIVVIDGMVTEGNAGQTASDIVASQGFFRLGIISLILVVVLDVVVAWALYRVFAPVNASLSILASAMRLVYSGVFMVAIGQLVGVVRLLSDEGNGAVFGVDQVQAQAMVDIAAFNDIWYVGQTLFGAHLLLIGFLAYKSGYIPKLVGALLVIAGTGYVIDSFGAVISQGSWTDISAFTFLGEFLLAVWLVSRSGRIGVSAAALEARSRAPRPLDVATA